MQKDFIKIFTEMVEAMNRKDIARVQELTKSLSHDELVLVLEELRALKKQRSQSKNVKTRVFGIN
jgi:hypothetical protein